MKRKRIFLFLAIGLLAIILLGSTLTQDSTETSGGDEYDTAFYVDGSKNIFIMTAKLLDKCCYNVVDVVVSGIGSIFNSILRS